MKASPDTCQNLVLDYPAAICQAMLSTHSSLHRATSTCLHRLPIHHTLWCVFRHRSATQRSSVFFLHWQDPYFRPPGSQVGLWRGLRHLSAGCVCTELGTKRRMLLFGHGDTSCNIISTGYTQTDRGDCMRTKSVSSCLCGF